MLAKVLERLGLPNVESDSFAREASLLSASERLEAAIIHVGSLLGVLPDTTSRPHVRFGALETELSEVSDGSDISYDDIKVGFHVEGANLVVNDGPREMASLLELLLYARDRSDTLLYLPGDMRQARIEALAERTRSTERFVRYLLANAPAIERKLAA